jgi:hypothetical protein
MSFDDARAPRNQSPNVMNELFKPFAMNTVFMMACVWHPPVLSFGSMAAARA